MAERTISLTQLAGFVYRAKQLIDEAFATDGDTAEISFKAVAYNLRRALQLVAEEGSADGKRDFQPGSADSAGGYGRGGRRQAPGTAHDSSDFGAMFPPISQRPHEKD